MDILEYKKEKDYYFDVLFWFIRLEIYHVRLGSYPKDFWINSLREHLKIRNEISKQLCNKVYQPGLQLSLF